MRHYATLGATCVLGFMIGNWLFVLSLESGALTCGSNIFGIRYRCRALILGVMALVLFLAPLSSIVAEEWVAPPINAMVDDGSSEPTTPVEKVVNHCLHCSHHQADRLGSGGIRHLTSTGADRLPGWDDIRPDDDGPLPLPKPPRA